MILIKENINSKRNLAISLVLIFCLDVSAADKEKHRLSDVRVDANATSSPGLVVGKKDDFQGTTTISRKMIEATPSGNGDITSLLKANPSVKFSNTNRQSTTMGEIDPADISINGSKFYQNSFIVDGMSINNDIDPAGNKNNAQNVWEPLSGSSQGMAIDSDFIESLDVHDSDVSAKYGGFTGGVIDAKTRDPKKGFHGKFSMAHTRDNWTKYHISENMEDDFQNSSDASNQPKFKKYTTRLNLEGFLTDDLGLMFGYTNTRSIIPLKAYRSSSTNEKYVDLQAKQRRNIDNYFLKALWYANDRLTITPSIVYAPQWAKMYRNYAKDSFMYQKSGGITTSLSIDYEFDFAKMYNQISYSSLESSRDSENQYNKTWSYSTDKDWGKKNGTSQEGALGDINQEQKTLGYKSEFVFNEFKTFDISHNVIAGLEVKKQEAFYEIPEKFILAFAPKDLNGASCNGDPFCSEGITKDGWRGQYLTKLDVYNQGKINVNQNSWAVYFEDKMDIGRLSIRPGVRFAGDSYMDKKTVAPRFSASYDVFDDANTILSFGKNRYYGRNIFAYRLKDGRNSLQESYSRRALNDQFKLDSASSNNVKFSQLDIPYDDETTFGIKQKIDNFELAFKYIDRKGRDQIITTKEKNLSGYCGKNRLGRTIACNVYSNDGYSDTQTWNVALRTIEPFKIMSTNHIFEISYEHFKTKTNASNYDTTEDTIRKDIYYNGKIIDYGDLPARDYNRPWAIKFTSVSKIPQYGITLSNFLSYQGSVNAIVKNGNIRINRKSYDHYEDIRLGKSFSWDSRIGYEVKLPKNMSAFVNLDIYNILNRSNKAKTKSTNSADTVYEAGRQFWLEAGLKW